MEKIFNYVREDMFWDAVAFCSLVYLIVLASFLPVLTQQHSGMVGIITQTNETCFLLNNKEILNVSLDTSMVSPEEFRNMVLINSTLGNETITSADITPCDAKYWNATTTKPLSIYEACLRSIRGDY